MATRTISNPGGTRNWNDTATWVEAVVPTAADDVVATGTSGNLVVTASSVCRSFVMTNYVGTLSGTGSWSVGDGTTGHFLLVSGMTRTYTGALTFVSTTTGNNITLGTKTLASSVVFNGVLGGWTLQDTFNNGPSDVGLTAGTLNTNGFTVTCSTFTISGSVAKTLTFGASPINCEGWAATGATNLVFNVGTSVITVTGYNTFGGGGLTYNSVVFVPTNLSINVNEANFFGNLTLNGSASTREGLSINANQTVTGTLTLNGNSAINRLLIQSNTVGTARTITAATVVVTNADFQDITGAGASSWNLSAATGGSGDCGGNSGIIFTTAATQTSTGTASFAWSTHGWTSRVPLPQDNVSIPNAFIATRVVTADMPRLGRSIIFSCSGSPTFTKNTANVIFGSLDLTGVGSIIEPHETTFAGRSSFTITSAGRTFTQSLRFHSPSGTYTLQDDLISTGVLVLVRGTLDANNKNVRISNLGGSGDLTRSLLMGNGTWELTSTDAISIWNFTSNISNLAFNNGGSTIKIIGSTTNIRTFSGLGLGYNNLWFSNATANGQLTITGSNTFADIRAGVEGNAQTLAFTAGTTTTVNTFTVSGTSGNLITIGSVTAANHTLTKAGGGIINREYLSISRSTATPANTWNTNNSINGGNNSGWIFVPIIGIRDQNRVPALLGVLNTDGITLIAPRISPTSHALKVGNATGGADFGTSIASRDGNRVTNMMAVSSADNKTPVALYVDSTYNLLINSDF